MGYKAGLWLLVAWLEGLRHLPCVCVCVCVCVCIATTCNCSTHSTISFTRTQPRDGHVTHIVPHAFDLQECVCALFCLVLNLCSQWTLFVCLSERLHCMYS